MIVLRVYVFSWDSFSKLIETVRIAIWDKDRTIVAIATGIWGMNIVFFIQGESLPPSLLGMIESLT